MFCNLAQVTEFMFQQLHERQLRHVAQLSQIARIEGLGNTGEPLFA